MKLKVALLLNHGFQVLVLLSPCFQSRYRVPLVLPTSMALPKWAIYLLWLNKWRSFEAFAGLMTTAFAVILVLRGQLTLSFAVVGLLFTGAQTTALFAKLQCFTGEFSEKGTKTKGRCYKGPLRV